MEELLEDERSAMLVEPYNFSEFSIKVLALIRDPVLRSRLGQAGQNRILTRFNVDKFVKSLTSVYDELLGNRP
jgi:glycosyltransferase involved in cell wall biosynthesis